MLSSMRRASIPLIAMLILAGCGDRKASTSWQAQDAQVNPPTAQALASDSISALACSPDHCPYITAVYNSDPVFQEAFQLALSQAGLVKPEWFPNGVHTPVTPIQVGQTKLFWGTVCEPHNCTNIVVAYAPHEKRVGGLYPAESGYVWFGSLLESERSALCVANQFECSETQEARAAANNLPPANVRTSGTPSAPPISGIQIAQPAKREWWTPQVGRTKCINNMSPATRLELLQGLPSRPEAEETRNAAGELVKVAVSIYEDGGLTKSIWSFYTSRDACERAEINDVKALADKYR